MSLIGSLSHRRWIAIACRLTVFAVGAVALSLPARAQLTIKGYRELVEAAGRNDDGALSTLTLYSHGFWNAVEIANEAQVRAGAKQRICLPRLALKEKEVIDAIETELARDPRFWNKEQDLGVGAVAIRGLVRKFACK